METYEQKYRRLAEEDSTPGTFRVEGYDVDVPWPGHASYTRFDYDLLDSFNIPVGGVAQYERMSTPCLVSLLRGHRPGGPMQLGERVHHVMRIYLDRLAGRATDPQAPGGDAQREP